LQAIAAAIAVGVIMHAGIHMACDFPRLIHSDDEKFKRYLGSDFDFAKPTYPDLVKGVEGLTGMAMVVVMVIAFVLASRWFRRNLVKLPWPLHRMTGFNAFWYSHHLFVILYVLLIIHSQYLYLNHDWRQKTVRLRALHKAYMYV
jgi:respiratory burst oxidase